MSTVKIGPFSLFIDNGGLLLVIRKDDKEDIYKFNPDESISFLKFLSQHQDEFNAGKAKGAGEVRE